MRGDQVGEQQAIGLAQCQPQGITEQLEARANVPAERVQDLRTGSSGDQAVEDAPAVEAEDVAQHAPDADAAAVENLLHAVAGLAALGDQRAPMADQIAQVAKRLVGNEARLSESEPTHPGQPTAVFDVGLAAAQLPHVLRVQQLRLDAGGDERAPRRVPVNAGPLQGRRLDAVPGQPGDQGVQAAGQRTESACLADRFTAGRCAEPHRGRDLQLVHVESRGAGMDNVQVIVPHRFASCSGTGVEEAGWSVGRRTRVLRARCTLLHVHGVRPGTLRGSTPTDQVSLVSGKTSTIPQQRPLSCLRRYCAAARAERHRGDRRTVVYFMPSGR